MRRSLTISADPIDEPALLRSREIPGSMGAVVHFLGVVRADESGQPIAALEYEAFEPMARHQFNLLFDQAEQRWPLDSIRLVHRLGRVNAGESSLWLEIVAPHRAEAFAAAQFIVDEMKRLVPIWKKPIH